MVWNLAAVPAAVRQLAVTVFPTGRFFGRITQKGPSKNVRPCKSVAEFWLYFPRNGQKGAKY
jgi:hypothetical protein